MVSYDRERNGRYVMIFYHVVLPGQLEHRCSFVVPSAIEYPYIGQRNRIPTSSSSGLSVFTERTLLEIKNVTAIITSEKMSSQNKKAYEIRDRLVRRFPINKIGFIIA